MLSDLISVVSAVTGPPPLFGTSGVRAAAVPASGCTGVKVGPWSHDPERRIQNKGHLHRTETDLQVIRLKLLLDENLFLVLHFYEFDDMKTLLQTCYRRA